MKGLVALFLLLLPYSCAPETPVPLNQRQEQAGAASNALVERLHVDYPTAEVDKVKYLAESHSLRSQIQQFQVRFASDKAAPSREALQAILIDYFTQKNHPEGSCVQVMQCSQGDLSCFNILVVCVN